MRLSGGSGVGEAAGIGAAPSSHWGPSTARTSAAEAVASAASEAAANQAGRDYASAARRHLRQNPKLAKSVFMLGPALAPLARLKGKYRWQTLFKSRSRAKVRQLVISMLQDVGYFSQGGSTHKNVRVIVDVGPISKL